MKDVLIFFILIDLYFSSVVPKSGLIPFHPQREPYKSYSTRLKHFLTDAGVKRATNFHNNGEIPKMFKWLILGETGYLDPTNEDIESAEFEDIDNTEGTLVVSAAEEGEDISNTNINESIDEIIEKKKKKKKIKYELTKKEKVKDHKIKKPHIKRGRKPKNHTSSDQSVDNTTNDSLSNKSHEDSILSPKTINPLERMKIEALISSTSNESASVAI